MTTWLLTFCRIGFLTLYSIEGLRLYYATQPCAHPSALPFLILILIGVFLSILQLRRARLNNFVDLVQFFYSSGVALTWLVWGNLRGTTLGALKGALGLTASPEGGIPAPNLQELSCFASHWSLTSFVLTDSKQTALLLTLLSAALVGLRLWPSARNRTKETNI